MDVQHEGATAILTCSATELMLLSNAITQALQIEDWEFSSLVGVEKDVARTVRAVIGRALDTVRAGLPPEQW
ncbi:hypothetical protein [Actinokineospora inagensis]|uniref:hypothetical protein n=1 Tax=Actinokineospora inagensis TaxID=103730 RepID=UPI0004277BC8|nr:hypothetical protein [Actinokineospora inagensis]